MHEVHSYLHGDRLEPSVALICYTRHEHGRPGEIAFVSRHAITVEDDVPKIQAGEPLREAELTEIVKSLVKESLQYLDERVLAQTCSTFIWWTPPARRTLWWKPVMEMGTNYDALPTRRRAVPVPGLVFRLDLEPVPAIGVFAVKGAARPTPATPLYHAPFANVYDLGGVCMGNAPTAKEDDWGQWERTFFSSVFTHDVGDLKRVRGFARSFQALDNLAEAKATSFPEEWLRPANKDLAWYIAEGRGGEQ